MKQRQYNNVATIQVGKEKWVNYFLPFYGLFLKFISFLRDSRRSTEALKYSEQFLLLTRRF